MWKYFHIFNLLYCIANATLTYNTFTRELATPEEIAEFEEKNIADICTVTIEPCQENEWRRIDGSCNNLKYPSHGTIYTPELRLLPANYSEGFGLRKTAAGEDFPLARLIRSYLLRVGDGIDQKFATSASYFIEFMAAEVQTIHDIDNYALRTTYCCKPEGLTDPMCAPNYIPEDDSVHRFSKYRCINMTVPKTFQNQGCAPADTVPSRINMATPHMDLSSVYFFGGNATAAHDQRAYEGGKLKVEVVNGISLPSDATNSTTCFIKQARETGCTRNVPNSIAGTNLFTTWFWRNHNRIADKLAELNPCWDDETLFHTAKDINIACHNQIVYYDFFPHLLGEQNMIDEGLISSNDGFRDMYDEEVTPGVSMEYAYMLRWFHITQDGQQQMFDENDNLVRTFPMVNWTLVVHDFAYDNSLPELTRGLYNQPAGGFGDHTVHPDMAELGLGPWQDVLDIQTNDLAKGRYFGFPSYIQYRDYCTNYEVKHEEFDDLKSVMSDASIDEVKRIYKDVLDLELLAGAWLEEIKEGASVPPTVWTMMVEQLKRFIISDNYWYERQNRPHAFTAAQLAEVRKSTFAGLLCAIGDGVTTIQPNAFLRIGPGNEKVSCSEIPELDFTAWKDDTCSC